MRIPYGIVGIMVVFGIRGACADTVYLKNGNSVTGLVQGEDADTVSLRVSGGSVGFSRQEVARVERSSGDENMQIQDKWESESSLVKSTQGLVEQERLAALERWKAGKAGQAEANATDDARLTRDENSGHIFVDAVLNDTAPVTLLLDTGAPVTLLTKDVAEKIGIDLETPGEEGTVGGVSSGKAKVRHIVLQKIAVQGMEAENVEADVLTEAPEGVNFRDGLLGLSFLNRFNFSIDQQKNELKLEKK